MESKNIVAYLLTLRFRILFPTPNCVNAVAAADHSNDLFDFLFCVFVLNTNHPTNIFFCSSAECRNFLAVATSEAELLHVIKQTSLSNSR